MAPATWTSASRRNLVIAPMTLGIPPKSKISCLHKLQVKGEAKGNWSRKMAESKNKNGMTDYVTNLAYDTKKQNNKNKKNMGDFWFFFGRPFLLAKCLTVLTSFWASGWCQVTSQSSHSTRMTPVGTQLTRVCLLHFFVFQKNDGTPEI